MIAYNQPFSVSLALVCVRLLSEPHEGRDGVFGEALPQHVFVETADGRGQGGFSGESCVRAQGPTSFSLYSFSWKEWQLLGLLHGSVTPRLSPPGNVLLLRHFL
jgi:hypothetical protein